MAQPVYTFKTEKRLFRLFVDVYTCGDVALMPAYEPELQRLLSPKLYLIWTCFFRRYSQDPAVNLDVAQAPSCKWLCFRRAFHTLATDAPVHEINRRLLKHDADSPINPKWASKCASLFVKAGASIVDKYPDLGRYVVATYRLDANLPLRAAAHTLNDINIDAAHSANFYCPMRAGPDGSSPPGALSLLAAAATTSATPSDLIPPNERAASRHTPVGEGTALISGRLSAQTPASVSKGAAARPANMCTQETQARQDMSVVARTIGPADRDVTRARARAKERRLTLELEAGQGPCDPTQIGRLLDRIRSCPVLNYFNLLGQQQDGPGTNRDEEAWET
ncbi:hypothetical protein OC842_006640 [Tilletia horrida]|uniref:Uncharacterized protein n=1 Tax=Tilletia horrida TaxID=155126 RepID=A0AAN6JHV7_9BASI|nr:hypothetical protein OC842_006640 [Tilletia horrida]